MNDNLGLTIVGVVAVIFLLLGGVGGCMFGMPQYKIYKQTLQGEANLKQAEWERQIQIEDAKAKQISAKMLGEAELTKASYKAKSDSIRAIGTSNANKIIAKSLTPEYIRWLFVDQLDQTENQIIYIPTEGNIPIMEAGRK